MAAQAQNEAQSQVPSEVARLLSAERAAAQESIQQAVMRERISTEDEKRRAQLFVSPLFRNARLHRLAASFHPLAVCRAFSSCGRELLLNKNKS